MVVMMAHGLATKRPITAATKAETKTGIGSRRIFATQFKLQVLDSYRNDTDCKGNQRATARKYGIHRRQIQKWLQAESNLRNSVSNNSPITKPPSPDIASEGSTALLMSGSPVALRATAAVPLLRLRDDDAVGSPEPYSSSSEPERVPALSPNDVYPDYQLPLDFTTHSRIEPPELMPMDLSIKRTSSYDSCTKPLKKRKLEPSPVPSPPPPPTSKPVKLFKPYLDDYNNEQSANNNNNESYTLHELQPPNYYYHNHHPAFQAHQPYYNYKQRQNYSLDFKLRAIESYYQDDCCKGNQRAVAHKYNIHRRQVQKWLQQEEELRERTLGVKHMVR